MTREDKEIIKHEAQILQTIDISSLDNAIDFIKSIIEMHPFAYFSILKGYRFQKIWMDILAKTNFLDEYFSPNAATRIYYYINRLNAIICCETCGKPYVKQIQAMNPPKYFHCNAFCAQRNPKISAQIKSTKIEHGTTTKDLLERTKQRNREKYGVDWFCQTKEFEDKKLATWKSHGYDHPMQSDSIKAGMRDRYEQKYGKGIRWNFQNPDVIEKNRLSHQKNLGVDWPSQHPELKKIMIAKSAKTNRKNFYENVLMHIDDYEILTSKDEYITMKRQAPEGCIAPRVSLKWRCKKCGEVFNQILYQYGKTPRCLKCYPLLYNRIDSQEEIDLFNYVSSIEGSKYDCFRHSYWNWNLLDNGKLLDIVCINKETEEPEIAIEFNGVYWHSIANKEPGYHLMKTKKCEDLGIKLIHVWEDQWINNKNYVEMFLAKVLKDEYFIDVSKNILELDRSQLCKLWIPNSYELIEETLPELHEHRTKDTKRYAIEDCGKLICKKKT